MKPSSLKSLLVSRFNAGIKRPVLVESAPGIGKTQIAAQVALELGVEFKTIHASKGLEADHVILLSADSGRMGFPSEIVDDPLLSLVSPEEEAFQNAEERRVMYVAMTRATQMLVILTGPRV